MPTSSPSYARANLTALVAAFAAVYVIWGSTYLAIRFAIETLPPFLMAGSRFVLAGGMLLAFSVWRGAPRPTIIQVRNAAIVGILLLTGGNGLVCWAEQSVPSGIAALLIGTVPLWMTTLNWLIFGAPRPGPRLVLGIAAGFAGVALLAVNREAATGGPTPSIAPTIGLLLACVSWSFGSLISRKANQGESLLTATAMQMIAGGAVMSVLAVPLGDWGRFDPGAVTMRSLLAFAYLLVFGSLVAFSAYVWLLRVVSPAAVSTYAYVNPVVAVLLGWWLADEAVSARTLVAGVLIVGGVVLMTRRGRATPAPAPAAAGAGAPPEAPALEAAVPAGPREPSCAGSARR